MKINLTLNPKDIKEAIVEYLDKRGYVTSDKCIDFKISENYNYYDIFAGYRLMSAEVKVEKKDE